MLNTAGRGSPPSMVVCCSSRIESAALPVPSALPSTWIVPPAVAPT